MNNVYVTGICYNISRRVADKIYNILLKNLNSTEKKMSVDKQNGYKVITYNERRIPEVINDKSKNIKNEYEV